MVKYLIQINQKTEGPYTLEQIKQLKGVTREHLIWNDSLDNWSRLGDIINMPLSDDEKLILNSPPTAKKVNDIVHEKLKTEKKKRIEAYSINAALVIIGIYVIMLLFMNNMIDSGGTNSYPIFSRSEGSESMILSILYHTVFYLLVIIGITIGLVHYFVNNSGGLNPTIGTEKNTPTKYKGKWYSNSNESEVIHIYINGEIHFDTSNKKAKGYWWVNENDFYCYMADKESIQVYPTSFHNNKLLLNQTEYNDTWIEKKKNLIPPKNEEEKVDKKNHFDIVVLTVFPAVAVGVFICVFYIFSNSKTDSNALPQVEKSDSIQQPFVDSSKKDSSGVSKYNDYNDKRSTDEQNVEYDTLKYRTIRSDNHNYSFEVPSFFQAEPNKGGRIEYFYSMSNSFSVYSWVKEDYSFSEQMLRDLDAQPENDMKKDMENNGESNVKLITSSLIHLNNRYSYFRTYTNEVNGITKYSEEVIQVRGNKLIVIHQTCPYDLKDKYALYFYHIKNSIN